MKAASFIVVTAALPSPVNDHLLIKLNVNSIIIQCKFNIKSILIEFTLSYY